MLGDSPCILSKHLNIAYIILSLHTYTHIREGTTLNELFFFFLNYYRCTIYQNNGIRTQCSIQSIYIHLVFGTQNNYFLVFSSAFVYVCDGYFQSFSVPSRPYSITKIPYIIFPYYHIIVDRYIKVLE